MVNATHNATLIEDPDLCTLDTCPMDMAQIDYVPSLAGNLIFIAVFGLVLLGQLGLGIRYKTWSYLIAMTGGLVLEVVGYVARVQMHDNPFKSDPFLMYLVCLTIAPAFLSAAVYLCLSRIVVAYGEQVSRFRARTYTTLFITCDFIALLLQAAGGGIASSADTKHLSDIGIDIMVAGVSWQVASLALFVALCTDFALRVRKSPQYRLNSQFDQLRRNKSFHYWMLALIAATVTIFIRSVFRCAELSSGFDGPLANDQITFMILEGAMISIAVISITVFHPGWVWKGQWNEAQWHVRGSRAGNNDDVYSKISLDNRLMADDRSA
ncbi:Sphingoid long-chain base transporter RSB1 [Talaromyces islandicus]|uniref:Sphingoid long-chain base transporter RSB1 n=1 Tax=Talaromyces islandicus TaxID=28573 RepID=A0A0U1LK30_TALIS|nr:Sphingoid long-chain base transporter RSB1 [Talaromyces islandicus]